MARTVAQVLTSARQAMNDTAGRNAADAELLGYVVDALNAIKNMRPDLFLGKFATEYESVTTATEVPLTGQFFRPVVDFVVARAEMKDAEHVLSARAKLMGEIGGGFLR